MRALLCHISVLTLAFFALTAGADTDDSGWTWALNKCPLYPSATSGTFTADTSGGFSSSGTCNFVNSGFTEYSVTGSSGGTLASSTLYGLYTNDVLIVPPTLSTDVEPRWNGRLRLRHRQRRRRHEHRFVPNRCASYQRQRVSLFRRL